MAFSISKTLCFFLLYARVIIILYSKICVSFTFFSIFLTHFLHSTLKSRVFVFGLSPKYYCHHQYSGVSSCFQYIIPFHYCNLMFYLHFKHLLVVFFVPRTLCIVFVHADFPTSTEINAVLFSVYFLKRKLKKKKILYVTRYIRVFSPVIIPTFLLCWAVSLHHPCPKKKE